MGYCPFESRYNGLYRDTGQLGTAAGATTRPVWAMIWPSTWLATQPRGLATWPACARGPGCWGIVSRYEWVYHDRRATWPLGCIARQATIRQRTRPLHDAQPVLCARPGRNVCAVGVQLGFKVCTLCTQPNLDSGHCLGHCSWTLFMSTIHEVFKNKK